VGRATFSFDYRRSKNSLKVIIHTEKAENYKLYFAPALGLGSKIKSVTIGGNTIPFKIKSSSQVIQVEAEVLLNNKSMIIEMIYVPSVEVLPPIAETKIGDNNKGLKIISIKQGEKKELIIKVEGLGGQKYRLDILNSEIIKEVVGASLEENSLEIKIPAGQPQTFIPHTIIIKTS